MKRAGFFIKFMMLIVVAIAVSNSVLYSRFLSVDPLMKDYPWWTPYAFAGNTPIQAIDIDGLEPGIPRADGTYTTARDASYTQYGETDAATLDYYNSIHADGLMHEYNTTLEDLLLNSAIELYYLSPVDELNVYVSGKVDTEYGREEATTGDYIAAGAGIVLFGVTTGTKGAKGGKSGSYNPKAEFNTSIIPKTSKIYKRPTNATTIQQRASVQNQPCATCGANAKNQKNIADHKNPLVKEHYEKGGIDKTKMHSIEAVQPQCTSCSTRQGAAAAKYSKAMKQKINEGNVDE